MIFFTYEIKIIFAPKRKIMRKLTMSELNRMDVEEYRNVEKLPIVIVLDNIRSLSNVGSFFRTADAFRIETLFLCGITACPPHREIHKTALGADDSVQWRYFKTTVEACECLKNAGYSVLLWNRWRIASCSMTLLYHRNLHIFW